MIGIDNYLKSVVFEFHRYKTYGDKTFTQLNEKDIQWQYNPENNSIAFIVKHMHGNMLSRWTNFLTEDGEKPWRERDQEFNQAYTSKAEMIKAWKKGWTCLFNSLESINSSNFNNHIKIRNEEYTIIEAINRQLAHYASHVGQIILIGKMLKGTQWISLSIPKGASNAFNKEKFSK